MTDQQLVVSALRQVGLVLAEHIELGAGDADEVVTQLIATLFRNESDTNKLRFLVSIGYSRASGLRHAALHCRTS
jgi:hypothetical protein